jgi:hypothetical protein
MRTEELTTRSARFGVCEQHNTFLALVDQRFERDLATVIGLDFPTEAFEVNLVSRLGCSRGSLGLWLGRGIRHSTRLGGSRLRNSLGFSIRFGGLGLALLLGCWRRSRRGSLALAEFDHGRREQSVQKTRDLFATDDTDQVVSSQGVCC